MIETEKGIFTRTYKFLPPDAEVKGSYHSGKTRMLMEEKEDAYHHLRRLYNKVLQDNCDIGHNNFTREVYLTLAMEADAAGFGEKVDYDGKGFSMKSMQQMKMDTKDTIAPEWYEVREKDYMKIGSYYVRNFFISSIPESVPDSVLPDLAAVSSNSIVSVHYQSVDQELGFLVAAKLVGENTEVKNIPIRDTVADRMMWEWMQIILVRFRLSRLKVFLKFKFEG